MRQQVAAQSVIEELLRRQESVPARGWMGRVLGASPLGADSASWYRGALGEIAVGRILATLPIGWIAFHALPIGRKGADIDHLVIGPGGIVTINTKNHSGKAVWVGGQTLMVSGHKQPHIRNADHEAARVTALLRQRMPDLPAAHAVLAIVDPRTLTIKAKPASTTVLSSAGLRRWLLKRPVVLDAAQLTELTALIDDPATWPSPVHEPTNAPMARFAALDTAVQSARIRRRIWAILFAIAALHAAGAAAMLLIGALAAA
jgi:hypothetical protein